MACHADIGRVDAVVRRREAVEQKLKNWVFRRGVGIIILWFGVACNPVGTPEYRQTAPVRISPSFTLSPTVIATQSITETLSPNALLPDLLINLSGGYTVECSFSTNSQIWIHKPASNTTELLLGESGVDYNYPQWSPDGKFIAYVDSRQGTNPDDEGKEFPAEQVGSESIWIMATDGSDKRQVGELLQRIDYLNSAGFCSKNTHIIQYPSWSPNSKYILYVQLENGLYAPNHLFNYYLHDLITNQTLLLTSQKRGSQGAWSEDSNKLIILDDESLKVFTINSLDEIDLNLISFPLILPSYQRGYLETGASRSGIEILGNSLIGSFEVPVGYRNDYDSLQSVDLSTGEWITLVQFQGARNDWGSPQIGNKWAVACGRDGAIKFINPETWQILDSYQNPAELNLTCKELQLFQNRNREDIASFVNNIEGYYGIWVLEMLPNGLTMNDVRLVIEVNSPPFPENLTTVIDYAWKP